MVERIMIFFEQLDHDHVLLEPIPSFPVTTTPMSLNDATMDADGQPYAVTTAAAAPAATEKYAKDNKTLRSCPSLGQTRNSLKHKKRDIPLEELVAHMKIEEANRLKDKVTHSISQLSFKANLVESSGASGYEFKKTAKKGSQNKIRKTKPQKGANFKKPRKPKAEGRIVKCYVCSLAGHKAYQCRHRSDRQHAPHLNVAENNNDDIITAVVSEVNLVENNAEWVVDTGASKHFWATREFFTEFEDGNKGEKVYMGNSSSSEVLGKGNVLLKLTFGKTLAGLR
ncbi:hypothetical protein V6N13_076571 [Hibiscus sabdariffa]